MSKVSANLLMLFITITVILLALSMLSPCFQKRFLDDKNLYQYLKTDNRFNDTHL
jgi:hypothetical protein